jgi:hypothetical protein
MAEPAPMAHVEMLIRKPVDEVQSVTWEWHMSWIVIRRR